LLVLTRREGETIMIGDDIAITVVALSGEKVRLGIAAPKDVAVHRLEVYEQLREENQASLGTSKPKTVEAVPLRLKGKPRVKKVEKISLNPLKPSEEAADI